MRLDLSTWQEVEHYLERSYTLIIPTGSTEQHGPMGLIGTDALCAATIAERAAEKCGLLVAPTLAYTPAPFNLAFPGSASISPETFKTLAREIIEGFVSQGFKHFFFLNGHGANLEPLKQLAEEFAPVKTVALRIRSWWDFEPVNVLRREYYADWEGMHATPSEIAITQATHRVIEPGAATEPPEKLSADYIRDHAGDKHGPPGEHRSTFPDGRVGSHSALARPEHGQALLEAAAAAVAADCMAWSKES